MRHTGRRARQVLGRVQPLLVDRHGWKFAHEPGQRPVEGRPAALSCEPLQSLAHDLRVLLLAIKADDKVQDLIDEAHGTQLPRLHRLLGKADEIALLVHLLRENTHGMEVGKHDIAAQGEKRVGEPITVPSGCGRHEIPSRHARSAWGYPGGCKGPLSMMAQVPPLLKNNSSCPLLPARGCARSRPVGPPLATPRRQFGAVESAPGIIQSTPPRCF